MKNIISAMEDTFLVLMITILLVYFIIRTVYSYYQYIHKNIGEKIFSFGKGSTNMVFWGIWLVIGFGVMEFGKQIKGMTYLHKENIFLLILFIAIASFLIYHGFKKNKICVNGIATSIGCWKWTEIENYEWLYGTNSNEIKYFCITVPKSLFLFGKNKAKLKISKKEYLLYRKDIEEYFNKKNQTSA